MEENEHRPTCCKIENCNGEGAKHRQGHYYFPRGYCSYHYRKELREIKKQNK